MPTILITGACSGIGQEFVRTYMQNRENLVIAVDKGLKYRSPSARREILDSYHSRVCPRHGGGGTLTTWGVDVADEAQADGLCDRHNIDKIDLIIHSAGVRGLEPDIAIANDGSDVAEAESVDVLTASTMQNALTVNTIGTFVSLRAFVPYLRSGPDAKVIVMGSRMGSVGHNTAGGGYAYRASKAAQNAIVKSFSIDVPDVTFVLVHPGRVESNLVGNGVKEDGAVTAKESVGDMLKLIEGLSRTDSGRFMDRWGVDIPW